MRFIVFSIFINCIISATANTQNNANSSIDFSGIYAPPAFVAVVPVSEPDTYPLRQRDYWLLILMIHLLTLPVRQMTVPQILCLEFFGQIAQWNFRMKEIE